MDNKLSINAGQATIIHAYPIFISDEGKEVLVFQTLPKEEIRLNGEVITIEKLLSLLKSLSSSKTEEDFLYKIEK